MLNFKYEKTIRPCSALSFNTAVIVAALGYLSISTICLFSIVRLPSLRDLGLSGQDFLIRYFALNMQMGGMLIGGILWGVLGDKAAISSCLARLSLFSANILNGLTQSLESYAWLRLFAGIGLAGELGRYQLVSEVLPTICVAMAR